MQAAMLRILPAALWVAGLAASGLPAASAQEQTPKVPAPQSNFEGAIGLQLNNGPQYLGAADRETGIRPGLYLRWGRFHVATAGNFQNRRDDSVARGIGADLLQRDDLQVQFGLRLDRGRRSSDSAALAGLDDVRATLRARVSVAWRFEPAWQLGAAWNADLLGRDGGNLADVSISRGARVSPRTRASVGASLTWADARYMAGRFGISAAASARSGRPAYDPGSGLRDISLNAQLRTDIDRRWSVWAGAGVGRLLGPARDSPISVRPVQASAGTGFAWRF
jgi:MipA family protein